MSRPGFSQAQAQSQSGAGAEQPNPHGASKTPTNGVPNGTVPQTAHVPAQDSGPGHPQLMTRPVFYIHAPPPPFLQYQWPMPFYPPYHPFSGLGYGMMMPPFPPAPYMEPPAFFLPHAPVQPMDYRRMVHPHPHPNSATYLSQTRRPRPPQPGLGRETVSFGVQTEPREGEYRNGSPIRSCSDSGRGTAQNSPTSSTSSNQKNSNCENHNHAKDLKLHIKSLRSRHIQLVRQENVKTADPPNEEMCSVPDILMSTPHEAVSPTEKDDKLPSYEEEVANLPSSTVNEELLDVETVDNDKVVNKQIEDQQPHYGTCKHSLNISIEVCSAGTELALNEKSNAQTPCGKLRRNLNESVWSVESLPVCVPTTERLGQNTATEGPDVILEMDEEVENCSAIEEANQKCPCNSLMDSVQMSGVIGFSTPTSKDAAKQVCSASHDSKEQTQEANRKLKSKLNVSIWSVESLPVYVPTKEWLTQNTTVGTDIIVEQAEEAGKCSPCGEMQAPKTHGSSTDSVQLSDSFIDFSTQASRGTAEQVSNMFHGAMNEQTLEQSENAQTESGKSKSRVNVSIWSVESLPVYVPTKEWLAQNTTAGQDVIEELAEEEGNCRNVEEKQEINPSLSTDSVQMPGSFIGCSTPASKQTTEKNSNVTIEPMNNDLQKVTNLQDLPGKLDAMKKIESEPAISHKRVAFTVEEKLKTRECDKDETVLLKAGKMDCEESSHKQGLECGLEKLLVPLPIHAAIEVSPSKMDFGVQFPEQGINKGNSRMNHRWASAPGANYTSTYSEGYYGNRQKKRHFQYRNKGPERPHGPQEAFYPHLDKPGKHRGGKGRH